MDPTLLQSGSNNLHPITLTILPSSPSQQTIHFQSHTPPKQDSYIPIQTLNQSIPIQSNIPNYVHVPITPTTVPNNQHTISPEEKERIRLEQQRNRVKRYNEKVKDYKKIALIDSTHEKIKALLLLCYPELSQMSKYELDMRVVRMLQSLGQPL